MYMYMYPCIHISMYMYPGVVSLLEACATTLLFCAAFYAETPEGQEVDLERLTFSLEIAVISSKGEHA
jgi:hypothetical protein